VLAENTETGLELLKLWQSSRGQSIVVPEANVLALEYLKARGFQEIDRRPRMTLGSDVDWRPGDVFSVGALYCG